MAFNRVIQFKRFLKYLCPFLRLYRCCLWQKFITEASKLYLEVAKSLRQSHLSLHQFVYTQTQVFLCPNWSLEPCKFQFVALQTELWITQIDFFIGLTKIFRAYDNFLSLR